MPIVTTIAHLKPKQNPRHGSDSLHWSTSLHSSLSNACNLPFPSSGAQVYPRSSLWQLCFGWKDLGGDRFTICFCLKAFDVFDLMNIFILLLRISRLGRFHDVLMRPKRRGPSILNFSFCSQTSVFLMLDSRNYFKGNRNLTTFISDLDDVYHLRNVMDSDQISAV